MKIDDTILKRVIQPRQVKSHKGSYGRVLLIGGFYPYSGAIIMAALATVNSGAGLVTVATQPQTIPSLHALLPEAMAFDAEDRERLEEQIRQADVLLVGPGLGEADLAHQVLNTVINEADTHQSLVLDGSALNMIAHQSMDKWPSSNLILTPHQKEWERLSGLAIDQQTPLANQQALEAFPPETILVAKSHHTSLYRLGNPQATITVGGPYQATGGMGDTLAGMIAGFLAQFTNNTFESVAAATYLHSAIAQDLSKDHYVVLPTQISHEITRWMKYYSQLS